MKGHRITGGGGIKLHLVEAGNAQGRPILFIHGFSQCGLAWSRQLNSELADQYRLVAMDIRGHGLSEKPSDGYTDSRLWAEDVDAAIRVLSLDHPVLCAWSYGPLVALDYVRHFGEDSIGGLHFVGGVTKLGSEEAMSVLTPEFLKLAPGFFAEEAAESARSMESLLRLCLVREPSADELYLMLGYNLSVPPFVRKSLLTRTLDNDDVLQKVRKPVLITHGVEDAVVKPVAVEHHKARVPHAQIHMMAKVGHAPFWDDTETFNRRLSAFCNDL